MQRRWSDLMWTLVQLALMASAELVEALEPKAAASPWQVAWHRTALRATARHRIA
jgi:hypothetical protein